MQGVFGGTGYREGLPSGQPKPTDVADPQRLAILDDYDILDTVPEQGFDDVVRLATRLCGAPIALVSFVAADRQWFKARIGFPHCETDLSRSVCAHALSEPDLLVIPDLAADPRTAANPLVTDDPHIRFYAGAPLRTPEGVVLGSLCVIDIAPRPSGLSADQAEDLRALASQVMALLAMRRAVDARDEVVAEQRRLLRQAMRLDVLGKASVALATALDPATVLEPILSAGAESVGFEQCFIYDLAEDGYHLHLVRSVGVDDRLRAALACVNLDGPLCGIVVRRRGPLILRDVLASTEPRYAVARENGINGFAGYPIMSRGEVVGVISFTTHAPGFSAEALSFFAALAALVSGVRERLDAEEAIRDSDTRSRLAQEAGRVGTFEVDVASGLAKVSAEMCRIYGLPAAPLYATDTFTALAVQEDHHLTTTQVSRQDGTALPDAQYRIRRANDGALRWIDRSARFTRRPDGRPVSMFGTVRDITERQVLNEELSHRLKNAFAMVLSIATQSLGSVPERSSVEAFQHRVLALSAAHDILLRQSWGPAPIEEVVSSVLTGAGQADRMAIAGPPVELGSRAVLSLSLLLHELATNAAKYGALSASTGRVSVSWRLEGEAGAEDLVFDWRETGGPPVVAPASTDRKGFGSRLLQMGLAGTGGVELGYAATGFHATMRASAIRLRDAHG